VFVNEDAYAAKKHAYIIKDSFLLFFDACIFLRAKSGAFGGLEQGIVNFHHIAFCDVPLKQWI
jgi:hypothetical protein